MSNKSTMEFPTTRLKDRLRNRRAATRAEILMIVVVVILGFLLLGPWLLQQRGIARINTCKAKQFSIARAHLLHADDQRFLSGYINPNEKTLLKFADQPDRSACVMEPVLFYLYSLDSQADRMLKFERLLKERAEGELHESDYYRKLLLNRKQNIPDAIMPLPEMNCPDQEGPIDYRQHPDASTTVFNTGMPDARNESFPPDWRANGPFLDLTSELAKDSPVSLAYIDSHDGLSSTSMLSENIDAGGWMSTSEPDVGYVWIDRPTDKADAKYRDDKSTELFSINERVGQRNRNERESGTGQFNYQFARPSSYHVGGVNMTFCDGSTRFIDRNIDYTVFALMMSCDDQNTMLPGTEKPTSAVYRRETPQDATPKEPQETSNEAGE